jgi:transposase-like protein
MTKQKQEMNIMKLIDQYSTEDECRDALEALRFPDGVICPHCQSKSISRLQTHHIYECNSCGYQFSVTVGTIFHDSHLPLQKWFVAVYLMIESKKGISANQMKRTLNVSYKTAWYLCHRIRATMLTEAGKQLRGIVEVDETWVGGKTQGTGHGFKGNKSIAVGAVQRDGDIVLNTIEHADSETLGKFIHEHTTPRIEAIYTDELPAYKMLEKQGIKHETVNHSADEWVRGDIHTNSVENVWSLLKRSIMGSYHQVSKKHLDAYLDELEWRFNNRENPYLFRDTLLKLIASNQLEYKELVKK